MADIIIVLILIVIAVFAIKQTKKHMHGMALTSEPISQMIHGLMIWLDSVRKNCVRC